MNDASVLILGAVGRARPGDAGYHARVRAWRAALDQYPGGSARLNLVELSERRCGTRAVLLSAIVARNFGASHFVVGHDYDERGDAATGDPLYGRYTAQEAMIANERELGIETVMMRDLVHEEDRPEQVLVGFASSRYVAGGREPGAEAHARQVAHWFSYPSVLQEWQKPFRGRPPQGFTVFLTGLSGAGKSMIARILAAKLLETGDRHVTLLDGDTVRHLLSPEPSREHRDLDLRRLGYVAGLITQYRGIAICASIAPYAVTRAQVRAMVEPHGGFIEVHVATPLAVCEARARAGSIPESAGVSGPYETPAKPEITIDTGKLTAVQAAEVVLDYLAGRGLLNEWEARPVPAARLAVMRREALRDTGAGSWGWPAARQTATGGGRPAGVAAKRDVENKLS
jgi:sulfate adenylyltransferase